MIRRIVALVVVAGCAPAQTELRAPIDKQLGPPLTARAIADRLAQPLDVEAAVAIALANNARVAAALADIGRMAELRVIRGGKLVSVQATIEARPA